MKISTALIAPQEVAAAYRLLRGMLVQPDKE